MTRHLLTRATCSAMCLLLAAGTVAAQPHERGPAPPRDRGAPPAPRHPAPPTWHDGAHGHNRDYPVPGALRPVPPHAGTIYWGGVGYRFHEGVWYAPGRHGFVVVRPPYGIVVRDRPPFATVVLLAGVAYLYANGVYYREVPDAGYEVVPPPVAGVPPAAPPVGGGNRLFIYPRQGQSAEQQRNDEFECHRWAVSQVGFDPSSAATGQAPVDPSRRGDYDRARGACLEGRGYTVR